MALVTFLSDFGYRDHYVGTVRAAILAVNPALQVIDLCHGVPNCNIAHASFVLGALFRQFAKGTVHLVAVGSDTVEQETSVALQLEGHFFVGANNGLFSLISEQRPTVVVDLEAVPKRCGTFAAKNKYAAAAAMLASGKSIYDLGKTEVQLQTLFRKEGTVSQNHIQGHVIYVDEVGNLITNLRQTDYLHCLEQSPKKQFDIVIGRERCQKLNTNYDEVEGGECFFIFNDQERLEIGVRYGSAEDLLGLGYDTAVYIQFK